MKIKSGYFSLLPITSVVFLTAITACTNQAASLTPAVYPSGTPYASLTPITPSPMPSSTSTPVPPTETLVIEPSITPFRINVFIEQNTPFECKITNTEGSIFILSDELFYSYLLVNSTDIDEILEKNFPDWKNFSQSVMPSNVSVPLSVIIVDASIQKEYQISPIVTLVTLGESLEWELPYDGDVEARAKNISKKLYDSFTDWYLSESGEYQKEYPQIENAATYALYQFFQGDSERLESWCVSVQKLFLDKGN